MNRAGLNMTTGEIEVLARLAAAQRLLGEIADELTRSRTSKRERREELGRRLRAIKSSLRTVELALGEEPAP